MNSIPTCPKCGFSHKKSPFPEERDLTNERVCRMCSEVSRRQEWDSQAGGYIYVEDPETAEAAEAANQFQPMAQAFQEKAARWVDWRMTSRGLSLRDIEAQVSKIPTPIRNLIPGEVVTAAQNGEIANLKGGFGIGGPVGGGKSCALAAILKLGLTRWVYRYFKAWDFNLPLKERGIGGTQDKALKTSPSIYWVNWPSVSNTLQLEAFENGFARSLMDNMVNSDILVLDDLGRERIQAMKDPNATPFSRGQLEIAIDRRNGMMKPIFWTTNVSEKFLVELYGAATYSRLIQGNPVEWVEGPLDNLRLQ